MLQLERNDTQDSMDLREVADSCNMAAAFFFDDPLHDPRNAEPGEGLRTINTLKAGHPFELRHLQRAIDEVAGAQRRLAHREPHGSFPAELKEQYTDNLNRAMQILTRWKEKFA